MSDWIWLSARFIHRSTSLGFNLIASFSSLVASSCSPNRISCTAVFPICIDVDFNSSWLGCLIIGKKAFDDLFTRKNSNKLTYSMIW